METRHFLDLLSVLIWPVVVLVLALSWARWLNPPRYSDPIPGPSGQIIRHDREKDKIEVWDSDSGQWIPS